MAKKKTNALGGRPAIYPFDRWTDGNIHVVDLRKLKKTREAVTEAVRRRSRKIRRHCEVLQKGKYLLSIQFH